jgi:hypothetical protein
MEEAVIQGSMTGEIVVAGSGAPLLTSHQLNCNLLALCIQCNEGIMGECHRFDSILNFIMFSSIPLSFTGLASVVLKFLVHFRTQ